MSKGMTYHPILALAKIERLGEFSESVTGTIEQYSL